ncbi:MAG: DUF456 domain-containing protein [Kiritimatiellae bacterium]|nr:DUF456 domain-containing protein [Kiritimatiellia bacterium]
MEIILLVSAFLLLAIGLVGCAVPILPGPVVSYMAVLLLIPSRFALSATASVLLCIGCIVVCVFDYIVPAVGAKKFDCSRWGITGSLIGAVAGMFFGVLGMLCGPFIGAVIGEMIAGKNISLSLKGGFGAFLGFLSGVLIKVIYCLICSAWCAYAVISTVF